MLKLKFGLLVRMPKKPKGVWTSWKNEKIHNFIAEAKSFAKQAQWKLPRAAQLYAGSWVKELPKEFQCADGRHKRMVEKSSKKDEFVWDKTYHQDTTLAHNTIMAF